MDFDVAEALGRYDAVLARGIDANFCRTFLTVVVGLTERDVWPLIGGNSQTYRPRLLDEGRAEKLEASARPDPLLAIAHAVEFDGGVVVIETDSWCESTRPAVRRALSRKGSILQAMLSQTTVYPDTLIDFASIDRMDDERLIWSNGNFTFDSCELTDKNRFARGAEMLRDLPQAQDRALTTTRAGALALIERETGFRATLDLFKAAMPSAHLVEIPDDLYEPDDADLPIFGGSEIAAMIAAPERVDLQQLAGLQAELAVKIAGIRSSRTDSLLKGARHARVDDQQAYAWVKQRAEECERAWRSMGKAHRRYPGDPLEQVAATVEETCALIILIAAVEGNLDAVLPDYDLSRLAFKGSPLWSEERVALGAIGTLRRNERIRRSRT